MTISIIGTGNVATLLGKKFLAANHSIVQVYGRNEQHLRTLSIQLNAAPINDVTLLNSEVDVILIAVKDDAIELIVKQIEVSRALLLHTAGSISINVLSNCSQYFGVLYPIQSIIKDSDNNTILPFLIDANNDISLEILETLAQSISSKISVGDDDYRLKIHLAAVFANNFTNFLYAQSASFCKAESIDFTLLHPLIEETALRLRNFNPNDVFTGPAKRKDYKTIEKHLCLLECYPAQKEIYKFLTNKIIENE